MAERDRPIPGYGRPGRRRPRRRPPTRLWLTLALVGLLTASAAGAGLWYFYFRDIRRIGRLEVASVDLNNLANGLYQGRFTTPYKDYLVQVRLADGRIEDIDIRPGNDDYGHYDRLAASVKPRIMFNQRIDVDAVSGATVSSKAILKAMEAALTKPPIE